MPLYSGSDYDRRLEGSNPTGSCRHEPYRSEFRRDYGRLIHCAAFRRLKGKTQLFPEFESDFFRNRLTHSIEVAQIAKSIAAKLSYEHDFFKTEGHISSDVVEVAGLAHDLGHPPFGHNGEMALDECMMEHGGFEGNAQTLRILSVLEKKATDGAADDTNYGVHKGCDDRRHGLDLCARTLAAVLKYDREIPQARTGQYDHVCKGYYASEAELVGSLRAAVLGMSNADQPMKTLECSIMDLADDIAYSTYDLEDAFKGNLLSPIQLISSPTWLLQRVADAINRKEISEIGTVTADDVRSVILLVFEKHLTDTKRDERLAKKSALTEADFVEYLTRRHQALTSLATVGYVRTEFTADLVGEFVKSVEFKPNETIPALSRAFVNRTALTNLEVLKTFTYECLIMSPRLKVAAYRGKEIVKTLFEELNRPDGHELLPDDFRRWFENFDGDPSKQKRVVCDFIAGMTDRYAVEFYARLKSEDPATIFKPI